MSNEKHQFLGRLVMLFVFLSICVTLLTLAYLQGMYFKMSPIAGILVSLLGALMTAELMLADTIKMTLDWNIKKGLLVFVVLCGMGFLCLSICYGIIGDYLSLGIVILWGLPLSCQLYVLRKRIKPERINASGKVSLFSMDSGATLDLDRPIAVEAPYDINTKRGKAKCFFVWFLLVFISMTVVEMAVVVAINTYYVQGFPTLGTLKEVSVKPRIQPSGERISMRLNCFGRKLNISSPTILFEHDEGSNGLAFAAIQDLLSQSGHRSCSYDREGYGRSENGPTDDNPQQRTDRLNQLLKINQEYGPFVLVGWAAGVEAIQTYYSFFESDVVGMVFIDGYPNRYYLQAIKDGHNFDWIKSKKRSQRVLFDFFRWTEPLGSGLLRSPSNFKPQMMEEYYNAYDHNYRNWHTQYINSANSGDYTSFLTNKAKGEGSPNPYNSSIPLNWPNIEIPLLLLPSSITIEQGDSSNEYYQQCLSYLAKARRGNMAVLEGGREVVYTSPYLVFSKIKPFVESI